MLIHIEVRWNQCFWLFTGLPGSSGKSCHSSQRRAVFVDICNSSLCG